jgi:hypothetical protein
MDRLIEAKRTRGVVDGEAGRPDGVALHPTDVPPANPATAPRVAARADSSSSCARSPRWRAAR